MNWQRSICVLVAALAVSLATVPAAAQTSDDDASGDKQASEQESSHGEYAWKPSYGGGIEYGLFFTDLSRWNSHLLRPGDGPTFDIGSLSSFQFAIEASFLRGSRLTLFAGLDTPFSSNPELTAIYGGLEPAFAFRRDDWEMGLGLGVGLGSINLDTDNNRAFDTSLVTLRPFFEVRRYLGEFAAGYLRFGFNQWLPFDADSGDFQIRQSSEAEDVSEENLLYEGGVYAGLGIRFGHYPKHVRDVPDSDDDGRRDDVDECPDEAEDVDDFEDADGCPDTDNDQDDVDDEEDKCPNEAEDQDGFEDEDGCPDPDNDGDGVDDEKDDCPDRAEDVDDFEDDDGCPDPDNDGDGVDDEDDECPDEAGIPAESGCPSEIVSVEGDKLVIDGAIEFEAAGDGQPATTLTTGSGKLLDELAQVLKLREEFAKVDIRVHPGAEAGNPQKLADARAETILEHLTGEGVAEGRLAASGVTDAEGRKSDEAGVEFHIVDRKEATNGDE